LSHEQRTDLTIAGIHHVQITCPTGEEETARHFYCDVLGFTELRKPTSFDGRGGLWLAVGGLQLHIGTEDGVDRRASKAHVAYAVTGLPAWRERLAAQGIETVEGVPIPGYRRCEFRDPFGNRVEFIEAE
jgi:catechol 2,3-dioxygenase-like lactoylglutathione lyase family enzyme